MVLPWPESSLKKRAASRNIFKVFWRSIMWMPLRSPKMYSFIFGFHRRVWWPKWTPASRSSFIVISTANVPPQELAACSYGAPAAAAERPLAGFLAGREFGKPALPVTHRQPPMACCLALAELEALSRSLLPVLLALFHARIARQKSVLAQAVAQFGVEPGQRARQPHAHRARLPAGAAALGSGHHVHLGQCVGKLQRLNRSVFPSDILEIIFHVPAVHLILAAAQPDKHPRHRLLAAPRAVEPRLDRALNGRCCRTHSSSSTTSRKPKDSPAAPASWEAFRRATAQAAPASGRPSAATPPLPHRPQPFC